MSEKSLENQALDDAALEQVSGGLYWSGSSWVAQSTQSGSHNNSGGGKIDEGSFSQSLPSSRIEVKNGQNHVYKNKGDGEYLFGVFPIR